MFTRARTSLSSVARRAGAGIAGPRRQAPLSVCLMTLVGACLCASTAGAQSDDPVEDPGINSARTYLSVLPWERIDPYSGSLVLTFSDLVLPAEGAGLEFRLTRAYNSKRQLGFWRVGPGHVVNADAPAPTAPKIVSGDGAIDQSFEIQTGATVYRTRSHAVYSRGNNRLQLPNGVTINYGCKWSAEDVRYPTRAEDQYGNFIEYHYVGDCSSGEQPFLSWVLQDLGPDKDGTNQQRRVDFTYENGLLKTMVFAGRTWTYTWLGTKLWTVTPPVGPGWTYNYTDGRLTSVTTPNGGVVSYTYGTAPLGREGGNTTVVSKRSTLSTRDIALTQWRIAYKVNNGGDGTSNDVAVVVCSPTQCPDGQQGDNVGTAVAVTKYYFAPGIDSVVNRIDTRDGSGGLLQRDDFTFTARQVVGPGDDAWSSPLPESHTVTRGAQSWTTTYTYRPENFQDYGNPWKVREWVPGGISRTTERGYFHSESPYKVGQLATEQVEGTTYQSTFIRDAVSGFVVRSIVGGIVNDYTPDARGRVVQRILRNGPGGNPGPDGSDYVESYGYSWGVRARTTTEKYVENLVINIDGTVASRRRDALSGQPQEGTGLTERWEYDDLGRTTLTVPRTADPACQVCIGGSCQGCGGGSTTTTYDNEDGAWIQTTRKNSVVTQCLDGYGRAIRTENSLGVQSAQTYDALGRVAAASAPFQPNGTPPVARHDVSSTYDALGRLVSQTRPDGGTVSYAYTGLNVTITESVGAGQPARQTSQEWSPLAGPGSARLTAVQDAAGQWTTYGYDILGALTAVCGPGPSPVRPCNANSGTRTWTFSESTHLPATDAHPESGVTSYTYDYNGLLKTRQDAGAVQTTYTYDHNNRLDGLQASGRPATGFEHDVWDNRTSAYNGDVSTTWTYAGGQWLTQRSDAVNGRAFVTTYPDYDQCDNYRQIWYPSSLRVHIDVDTENRVTQVFNQDTARMFAGNIQHHPAAGVRQYTAGNGLTHSVTFDDSNRPSHITSGPLDLTYYSYDHLGNVRELRDARPGFNQQYEYDSLDRLTSATGPWGTVTYSYHPNGDRLAANRNGAQTTYGYSSPTGGRLTGLSGAATESFSYTGVDGANGRVTQDAHGSYAYSPEGLLERAQLNSGVVVTYKYDADGLRTAKTWGGTTTYFVRGQHGEVLSEFSETGGTLQHLRDYVYLEGRLVATTRPSARVDHQTTSAAALTTLSFQPTQVIDGNPATAWSSVGHTSAAAYETVAVWWEWATTSHIRLVPRIIGGVSRGVPQFVSIYYSANGTWNYAKTVNLPADLPAGGYQIPLDAPVYANGVLLVTNQLRTDQYGSYAFQMAEIWGGHTVDYVRTAAAASSTAVTDFAASRAIDAQTGTSWSSNAYSTSASYEWLAVWWEWATTNYVRLVPSMVGGVATCVPQSVNIYYSANGVWNYAKTVDLPADMPASGYLVYLNAPVYTNGVLLTSNSLRADSSGTYYFRMAEVSAGLDDVTEYYHLDALGSVRAVTDGAGQARRHDFLPFGEEYQAPSGAPDRMLFTGQARDFESALDYFGARYYRADLGRFTTIDPLMTVGENVVDAQRWNRYTYVGNNPLRFVDPTGMKAQVTTTCSAAASCQINVKATFSVYAASGSGLSAQELAAAAATIKGAIESAWSGSFTKDGVTYVVTTNVTVGVAANEGAAMASGAGNVIGLTNGVAIPGVADSYVDSGSLLGSFGPDTGKWNVRSLGAGVAAHEFTHLLGVGDHAGSVLSNTRILNDPTIPRRATREDYARAFGPAVQDYRNLAQAASRAGFTRVWAPTELGAAWGFFWR
jgi:RHS repeat-associated protein